MCVGWKMGKVSGRKLLASSFYIITQLVSFIYKRTITNNFLVTIRIIYLLYFIGKIIYLLYLWIFFFFLYKKVYIYIYKVIYIKSATRNTLKWYAEISWYRNISFQWINRNGFQNGIHNIGFECLLLYLVLYTRVPLPREY